METELEINKREIARYLGYGGHTPDEQVMRMIDDCVRELDSVASPKHAETAFAIERMEDGALRIGSMTVTGAMLARNLSGCGRAMLFAATLGVGVDNLLRRTVQTDVAKTVVLQAAAAAAIEGYCNKVQRELNAVLAQDNLHLRPRYSPGYGDLDLDCQRGILDMLCAPKRIGLTLTDGLMLAPAKSVTAIMGISGGVNECNTGGCEECGKLDCNYRR